MATVLDEFVGKLGWQVDSSGPKKFAEGSKSITAGFAKITAAYTTVSGLVSGFIAATNEQTASVYRLAKSLGVSYSWLDTWGDAMGSVAGGTEGVAQAMLFLSRSIGNANMGMAETKRAFSQLGLDTIELAAMDAGDRYKTVLEAAFAETDSTKMQSVMSRILGESGSANVVKLKTYLDALGFSLDDYITRFDNVKFETETSARGAFRFSESLEVVKVATINAKNAVAGLIGEALAPMLESVISWIKSNRELIRQKIAEWAKRITEWLKSFWGWAVRVATIVSGLVNKLGGLGSTLKLIGSAWIVSKLYLMRGVISKAAVAVSKKLIPALRKARAEGKLLGTMFKSWPVALTLLTVAIDKLLLLPGAISDVGDSTNELNTNADALNKYIARFGIWAAEIRGIKFKDEADKLNYLARTWYSIPTDLGRAWDRAITKIITASFRLRYYFNVGLSSIKDAVRSVADWLVERFNSALSAIEKNPVFSSIYKMLTGKELKISRIPASNPTSTVPKSVVTNQSSRYYSGNTINMSSPITVNAAPGMDARQLGAEVERHIERAVYKAVKNSS